MGSLALTGLSGISFCADSGAPAPPPDPPGAPVLSITGYDDTTSVQISWTTPSGSPTDYEIYVDDILFDTVPSSPGNVYGLTFNTDYSIYVKAINAGGASGPSNTVTANTVNFYELYDTFTDNDGTQLSAHTPEKGTTWDETGSIQVQSNNAEGITLGATRFFCFATMPVATADGYTQITLNGTDRNIGFIVNVQDVDHNWMVWVDSNGTVLYEQTAKETFVNRGSSVGTFPIVLKAVTNGDTIEVYADDVLVITYTVTDRPFKANAKVGIMIYDPENQHTKILAMEKGV